MARRKRKGRTTRRFGVTGSYKGAKLTATYQRSTEFSDENMTSTIGSGGVITDGVTHSLLILGTSDLGTADAQEGRRIIAARLDRGFFTCDFFPSETVSEGWAIQVQTWMMMCPALVATDWVTNSRVPAGGIRNIAAANPHRILSGPKFTKVFAVASNPDRVDARSKVVHVVKKPLLVKYPDSVFMMYNISHIDDGGTASIPNNELRQGYRWGMRVRKPITQV